MRIPIVAGNWKMFKTLAESASFAAELRSELAPFTGVERVVCPTFVSLAAVANALQGSGIGVGAQNVHWESQGAFTSQISPAMLQGLAEYVIIGHSECRQFLGDSDETVNKKVKAALAYGLKPILAVGENLAQNECGETATFVGGQVRAGLAGIDAANMKNIVVAYEPIWAINTGKAATKDDAQNIIGGVIRPVLAELYGDPVAQSVRIQYGGSVKPDNMASFMAQPDIDGALVGGASLKVADFVALVRAARSQRSLVADWI